MPVSALLALAAVLLFVIVGVYVATVDTPMRRAWLVPAGLAVLFLAFSLYAVATGGLLGFWTEHTRHAWGNQIWFDLLLGIGIGWFFAVPQAKALGMRPLPWLGLILATGSIGFLAMVARMLFLRERAAAA